MYFFLILLTAFNASVAFANDEGINQASQVEDSTDFYENIEKELVGKVCIKARRREDQYRTSLKWLQKTIKRSEDWVLSHYNMPVDIIWDQASPFRKLMHPDIGAYTNLKNLYLERDQLWSRYSELQRWRLRYCR